MAGTARRLGCAGLFLCLIGAVLAIAHNTWLRWMGGYLIDDGSPCKADIIVVLAGDNWGNRVLKGGELQRQGWAPKVLVSGAGLIYGNNEGDLAIRYALKAGYSPDSFVNLPSPGKSTKEESDYIVSDLRHLGVHRFILVTSDYHTHRAAKVYRKAAPDIPFCTVGAPDPDFSADGWWHTREGQKTFFFEWSKTVANFFGM